MNTSGNGRLNAKQRVPRQTLTSAVADRLRDKILRGEFRAGEQLRQHAIAAEFDVSRIPLREAFRQLEAEGLIEIIDHRGAVVSALSPEEIEELFDIRAALESVTLRHAVPRLTEEDLERAEESLVTYERALNDETDFEVWGELHWRFHSSLYAAANRTRFSFYNRYGHSIFDARPYSLTEPDPTKIASYRETFGVSFGGPLRLGKMYDGRDKTFFFINYDGGRRRSPVDSFATVPLAAERNGDFSARGVRCGLGHLAQRRAAVFPGAETREPDAQGAVDHRYPA